MNWNLELFSMSSDTCKSIIHGNRFKRELVWEAIEMWGAGFVQRSIPCANHHNIANFVVSVLKNSRVNGSRVLNENILI